MKKVKVGAILTQAGGSVGGGFAARKIADMVQDKIEDDMQEKLVLGGLTLASAYFATNSKGSMAAAATGATAVFGEILISSFMDSVAPAVTATTKPGTKAVKGSDDIAGDEMGQIHEEIMRAMEGNSVDINGNETMIVGVDDMAGNEDMAGDYVEGYDD